MSLHLPFASSARAGRGLLAAALAAGLAAASPALAVWIDDGVAVCTVSREQQHPVLVPTLNGGVIIVWWDARNLELGIYAQRLDADGNPLWATNGVRVGEIMSASTDRPVAISDGIGGVYVVWASTGIEINFERLIAQRIGPDGSRLWAPGGVVVCPASSDQTRPVGVSDLRPANFFNQPGIIVAWEDARAGAFETYAQHLDHNGVRVWGDLGVRLSNQGGDVAGNPIICPDGTNTPVLGGGAIVAWTRFGADADVYANRIDRAGAVQWGVNGVAVCTAAGDQISPAITGPHGSRTAFISWSDGRNPTNTDIYAQRIVDGVPSWTGNGLPVCNAAGDQNDPVMANSAIGAFVVWEDVRNPVDGDLYTQRIDNNGNPQFAANGVPLCNAPGNQFGATMVTDGQGGAFVAWVDDRGDDSDIYAQRMTENGNLLWQADGVRVCGAIDDQDEPRVIWDGTWLTLTWEDLRNPVGVNNYDVYASRLSGFGSLPGPAAVQMPEPAPASELRLRLLSSNPLLGEARLAVELPAAAWVAADVFGPQGRWVGSLGRAALAAGTHVLRWDGRDASGAPQPTGIYFVRVQAGDRSSVLKLVRMR